MSKSAVAGSYSNCKLSYIKYGETVFRVYIPFCIPTSEEWSSFSASSLVFCAVTIFYFKHSDKWVLISPRSFIYISLMANDTECFYMCLSALFFISLCFFLCLSVGCLVSVVVIF